MQLADGFDSSAHTCMLSRCRPVFLELFCRCACVSVAQTRKSEQRTIPQTDEGCADPDDGGNCQSDRQHPKEDTICQQSLGISHDSGVCLPHARKHTRSRHVLATKTQSVRISHASGMSLPQRRNLFAFHTLLACVCRKQAPQHNSLMHISADVGYSQARTTQFFASTCTLKC